jgi:hypothetical protein
MGRTQVDSQSGINAHSVIWNADVCGGMVTMDRLREIHIKICTARIVMYSRGHIC